MTAPRFHFCAGRITDDAGQDITRVELAILCETFVKAAEEAPRADIRRDFLNASRSACKALQASIEWALCSDGVARVNPTEEMLRRSLVSLGSSRDHARSAATALENAR